MVVGEYERHVETERGLRDEEIDGLRTVLDERVDALGVEAVARLMAQVGFRQIRLLVDSPLLRERCSRYPEPSARSGCRAAELRFLLDDRDVEIVRGRRADGAHA